MVTDFCIKPANLVAMKTPAQTYESFKLAAWPVQKPLGHYIWRRGKPESLLHHSDQGSQYTSDQFQRLLIEQGITCSMSRAGEVWDNSAMESFFSTLKIERVNRRGLYKTRKEEKADIFDYIECFYNPKRRHSTIGYVSPVNFESMQYA